VNESKRWPPRPSWGRRVLFVSSVLVLLLGAAAPGTAAPAEHGALLRDGVLVAPTHGLAFVMRPGGGMDALDLASGTVRWHSDGAAKPLALAGDRLIAQRESPVGDLEIVALDARRGARGASSRVPLPAGVAASVADTAERSFRVYAGAAGSQLVVQWESSAVAAADAPQGYLPAEDTTQSPSLDGSASLTMEDSQLALKAAPVADATAAVSRPELRQLSTPLAKAVSGRQFLSADGRHVLVAQMADRDASNLYSRRWTVYDRESGARLGSVPALAAASPFVVRGTTLYHVEPAFATRRDGRLVRHPAGLRAVDLQSGNELWKVTIRESDFRGPFPP
jgi:hypothetical protein